MRSFREMMENLEWCLEYRSRSRRNTSWWLLCLIEVQASLWKSCEFAVVCQSTVILLVMIIWCCPQYRESDLQPSRSNHQLSQYGFRPRTAQRKRKMTQWNESNWGQSRKLWYPHYMRIYIHLSHAHVSHLEHMLGFACLCSGWVVSSANYESNKSISAHPSGTLERFCWLVSPNGC